MPSTGESTHIFERRCIQHLNVSVSILTAVGGGVPVRSLVSKVSICIHKHLMRNTLDGREHLHLVEVLSGYRSCGGCFDDPDFGKIVSKTGFLSSSSNWNIEQTTGYTHIPCWMFVCRLGVLLVGRLGVLLEAVSRRETCLRHHGRITLETGETREEVEERWIQLGFS